MQTLSRQTLGGSIRYGLYCCVDRSATSDFITQKNHDGENKEQVSRWKVLWKAKGMLREAAWQWPADRYTDQDWNGVLLQRCELYGPRWMAAVTLLANNYANWHKPWWSSVLYVTLKPFSSAPSAFDRLGNGCRKIQSIRSDTEKVQVPFRKKLKYL